MDARRALTIGGGATVVAGIAVATAFAVSNAVALNDAAGAPVSAAPLVVPSSSASALPLPTASPVPRPSASTETVPAPEPRDVTAPAAPSAPKGDTSTATKTPRPKPSGSTGGNTSTRTPAPAPSKDTRTAQEVLAQFKKDGDWAKVEAWARDQGYDQATIDRWEKFAREWIRTHGTSSSDGVRRSSFDTSPFQTSQTPARAGIPSGHHLPSSWTGSKRERSTSSP